MDIRLASPRIRRVLWSSVVNSSLERCPSEKEDSTRQRAAARAEVHSSALLIVSLCLVFATNANEATGGQGVQTASSDTLKAIRVEVAGELSQTITQPIPLEWLSRELHRRGTEPDKYGWSKRGVPDDGAFTIEYESGREQIIPAQFAPSMPKKGSLLLSIGEDHVPPTDELAALVQVLFRANVLSVLAGWQFVPNESICSFYTRLVKEIRTIRHWAPELNRLETLKEDLMQAIWRDLRENGFPTDPEAKVEVKLALTIWADSKLNAGESADGEAILRSLQQLAQNDLTPVPGLQEVTFRDATNRVVLLLLVKLYKQQERYEEAIGCLQQLRPLEIALVEARYNERNRAETDPDPEVMVEKLKKKMDNELKELQELQKSAAESRNEGTL